MRLDEVEREVRASDFRRGTILGELAASDVRSGVEAILFLAKRFPRKEVYVPNLDNATKKARNRIFERELAE